MISYLRFSVVVVSFIASLSSSLYGVNKGAGVLPFTLGDDGEFYCLVGRETRHVFKKPHIKYKAYSDFGGKRDHESKIINGKKVFVLEPESKTALRELKEETGYTSFAHITEQQIQKAPYYDAPTGYRLYLLPLDKTSWRNGKTVQQNVSNAYLQNKPHVEKDIIAEVKVRDLLKAVNNPIKKHGYPVAIMPGTHDQLFNLFKECLQQTAIQNIVDFQQPGAKNRFNQLVAQGKSVITPPAAPQNLKDVVIAYHLSTQKKQELYGKYVVNMIPGKTRPDNYHVTLGWVQNVQPKHHNLLQTRLQKIADQQLASATFSVDSLKKYLVHRQPNQSPLVLTPKASEIGKLKLINQILYKELQKFNAQNKCNYKFHRDVEKNTFEPHITISNNNHITKHGINRDQTIRIVTQKIKAYPLSVLHPTKVPVIIRKVAVKKKPAPQKKIVIKTKPAPKKKIVVQKKPAPKKKIVIKKKPAPKKKIVVKKKPAPKKKIVVKKKSRK